MYQSIRELAGLSEEDAWSLNTRTLSRYRDFPLFADARDAVVSRLRNKQRYSKDLLLTMVLTDKCTLRCRHCFEEAGPEKNNFLEAPRLYENKGDIVGLIGRYPEEYSSIRITGGDPFLHPELYEIVSFFSGLKDETGYYSLEVETNGWWATDEASSRNNVKKLKASGVDILSMTADYFHCEQGVFPIERHFERIKKSALYEGLGFRAINNPPLLFKGRYSNVDAEFEKHRETCNRCEGIPVSTPIGRARELPKQYWGQIEDHFVCLSEGCRLNIPTIAAPGKVYIRTDEITVGPTGNVYPCNSGKEFEHATLSLGNLKEGSLLEVIDSPENPILDMIRKKGLRGIGSAAGLSRKDYWRLYFERTPCGLCHYLLDELGEEISKRAK
jgi:MoaA/NifB/PqqE/SkfB family radical SAM enzyme